MRALLSRPAAAKAGNGNARARQAAHASQVGRGQRASSDRDGRSMQAENEQSPQFGPAARHQSIRPCMPRSRSPSVDSEADVVPAARRSAVAWGRSIARHWASGSQGRARRPRLVLGSADNAALNIQRERLLRADASNVLVSPQRDTSDIITDNEGGCDISEERGHGHAGSEATRSSAPAASAGAVMQRSPLRSAREGMSTNAADSGAAAASSTDRCAGGVGQLEGGADASSDSPEVCPVPTWAQKISRRNRAK